MFINCGNSFNICLIDDNSFKNILPDWNINLDIVKEAYPDINWGGRS